MKVLVTGANGFVGGALTRRLLETGHEVHIFTRRDSDCWRIGDLLPHLQNHIVDLRDDISVDNAIENIKPEAVCHLATYGGFSFQQDTETCFAANLLGTVRLLRACARNGFECFINTGSSSEYGPKSSVAREADILEPLGDYGVSKAAATLFCHSEAILKGLPVVTLRLFSPYGPWDDPRRLVPYAIEEFLAGSSPKLSNPTSVRDYVFIEDVTAFYLLLLGRTVRGGEVFNVGSGEQHSIGEVVEKIREMTGSSNEPLWGALPPARTEPPVWCADIGKARSELGWQPAVSLCEGLETTISWIRERRASRKAGV